jgi:hypothetical protein
VPHRPDRLPEPDHAARFGQGVAQPLHQQVLRIDVMRPSAGQGGVLQHHRFAWGAELAAMVLDREIEDRGGDALVLQQPHCAVLDQPGLRQAAQVGPCLPLEDYERDALALQQAGKH